MKSAVGSAVARNFHVRLSVRLSKFRGAYLNRGQNEQRESGKDAQGSSINQRHRIRGHYQDRAIICYTWVGKRLL